MFHHVAGEILTAPGEIAHQDQRHTGRLGPSRERHQGEPVDGVRRGIREPEHVPASAGQPFARSEQVVGLFRAQDAGAVVPVPADGGEDGGGEPAT